jgi:hypothetical protein
LPAELAPEKFTLPAMLLMKALPAVLLLANPKFELVVTINAGALEELLMMPKRKPVCVETSPQGGRASVFQALPGASFIVDGATPAKNSTLTSAGTELRLANGVSLLAKFDGEFASHSSTYAGTGTFRYRW